MAVIKHSMTKEDHDKAGRGAEPPKPGTYRARVVQAEPKSPKDKDPRIEVIYEITVGDFKGAKLYDYITEGESSKWKKDQFWIALGLVKTNGSKVTVLPLDPARVNKLPEVMVRVVNEMFNEEPKAKVRGVYPLDTDSDDADAEADAEAEGEEDGEAEDDGEVDLDAMNVTELKEFADENELEIPKTKKTAAAIRSWLSAQLAEAEEDETEAEPEEDGEEEGEEEGGEEVDLSELSLKELRVLADENEIDHSGMKRPALEAALEEALGETEEEEGEDEEPEEIDYSDWSLTDLKKELTERGLKPIGSKAAMITKLKKSDNESPV